MTIHAVLLIPGKGQRALLAEGPCGSRPPLASHRLHTGPTLLRDPTGGDPLDDYMGCALCAEPWPCKRAGESLGWRAARGPWPCPDDLPRALVLAWEGEPVPEGMDRLCRFVCAETNRNIRYLDMRDDALPMLLEAVELIGTIPDKDLGTIVLLDEDGRVVNR